MTTPARYSVYRDSGVAWLGQIPCHWDTPRVKRAATLNPSKSELPTLDHDNLVSFVPMEKLRTDGTVDGSGMRPFREVMNGLTYFRESDLLLAKITPCFENGKCAIARGLKDGFGFGSTEYHVLRARTGLAVEYLYRIFSSKPFLLMGEEFMEGSAGQKRVPTDFIANLRIPLPPLSEQQAIARFLDRQDRRISRFIRAKQRLIALLAEQKQAIIHQAVTRGLDPDVPLKPSGIDWLGDVPAHWEVRKAKHLYREIDLRSISGDEELLSVSHISGVTPRSQKTVTMFQAETYAGHKLCEPNDLVVNTMWAWMGALGVSTFTGLVSPSYGVYRPVNHSPLSPAFANLLLRTRQYIDEYNRCSTGIHSSRLRLYPEQLLAINVLVPPPSEQSEILSRISSQTAMSDEALNRAQREIELIREYRTRLIADVVTGQLDVRNHPDAEDAPAEDRDDEPFEALDDDDAILDTEAKEDAVEIAAG